MVLDARTTILLVAGMLFTGTANTILNKYQDRQCVADCDGPNPHNFEQPLFQTLTMFIGEFSCIVIYLYAYYFQLDSPPDASLDALEEPLNGSKVFLMAIPATLDIIGTTLMNVGLIYTSASVYQMLRGSIVLFVGLLSVLFLRRKLFTYQWTALFTIVLGIGLVGTSSLFKPTDPSLSQVDTWTSIIGVLMVLIAQLFTASQFVTEEKIMTRYYLYPADAVWLEGLFGMTIVGLSMPLFHYFYGQHHEGSYFDVVTGYHQIVDNPAIFYSSFAIALSIAFFNFFGLSVTRTLSATSRSTIDCSRTLFIWLSCMYLGWETFSWMQVSGFVMLVYGTFLFNNVVAPPKFLQPSYLGEEQPLLN